MEDAVATNKTNISRDDGTPPSDLRKLLKRCRGLHQKLAGIRRAVDRSRAKIDALLRERPVALRPQPALVKSRRRKAR